MTLTVNKTPYTRGFCYNEGMKKTQKPKSIISTRERKLARYRNMLKKIDTVVGGHDDKVDQSMRKAITLLTLMGIAVRSSCEGHTDPHWFDLSPWIAVRAKDKKEELKVRKIVRSYWHYLGNAQAPDMNAIWIYDDALKQHKLLRIQIGPDHFFDLKKEKPKIPLAVRKWFIGEGQKEMERFTGYLWKRYLGEVSVPQNPPPGRRS